MNNIALLLLMVIVGIIVGYLIRIIIAKGNLKSSETIARKIITEAEKTAETKKREGELAIKEEMHRHRQEFEVQTKIRRQELSNLEKRLLQKEENLDKRFEIVEKRERDFVKKEAEISSKSKIIELELVKLNQQKDEQKKILEKISQMTADEAKKVLMKMMEDEAKKEASVLVKKLEQEAREIASKKAKEILAIAIQHNANTYTQEITVTNVPLPNDDMKGRIIGREGRNIRAFEQATGVDLIIDDTPDTITLSSFDGVRREIAKISLERLMADGRIHPSRIEEIVNQVKKEIDECIKTTGEDAALELGITNLDSEIIKIIGKLKYRTSYGQNQLTHTLEVANISGYLAAELGVDVRFCKRAGLLHDIGKAVDKDVEGTHHQISADIAKQYGESSKMINAILAHHEGVVQPESVEAFILQAADAISAARPGARRETLEHYLKRIERLEKVAESFIGVAKSYAVQAGREIRILVEPEDIDDAAANQLAHDIAKKIETELEYPGQIKVTVIRETRFQELAK
ncbi:MAG TPA: ribonuclease Y [Elusimicrobia bacterium]|nr:ribonuclease Y [Elusimicrobiota bacterium]